MNFDKIIQYKIDYSKLDLMLLKYNKNLEKMMKAKNIMGLKKHLKTINKIRLSFINYFSLNRLLYFLNIDSLDVMNNNQKTAIIKAKMEHLDIKYYNALITLKQKQTVGNVLGDKIMKIAYNRSKLSNVLLSDLMAIENELCQKYNKLLLDCRIDFNGKKLNLEELKKLSKNKNESIRKQSVNKKYELLYSMEKEINQIVNNLIGIRTDIAKKVGIKSYADLNYITMNRIDYDRNDIIDFRKRIKTYVVPLIDTLKEYQEKQKLIYFDKKIDFADSESKSIYNLDNILSLMEHGLKRLNHKGWKLLKYMKCNELMRLKKEIHQKKGSVTFYFPLWNTPLFIKNYKNDSNSITAIHHEFGHCMQLYYNKSKYLENKILTYDIAEIYSTSMEFLMYPLIDSYFNTEAKKYKIQHLDRILSMIVEATMMDEFQTYIYTNNKHSNEERNLKWLELEECYFPNRNRNHEYLKQGLIWQSDGNRIEKPFYCIDYAIAGICSLSFYQSINNNFLNNKKLWKQYVEMCKNSGNLSLKDFICKNNLINPFDEDSIKKLSVELKKDLEEEI